MGHIGARRFWRFQAEEEWGGGPSGEEWISVPIEGDGFKLKMKSPHFVPDLNVGGYQRKYQIQNKADIEGEIRCMLFPATVEALLNMAFLRDDDEELVSYVIEHLSPVEAKRFVGCRVNTATLAGDNAGQVTLALNMIGKSEAVNGFFDEEAEHADQIPFIFQHGVYELPDGTPLLTIENFSIEIALNLIKGPYVGVNGHIAYLLSGRQAVTGNTTILYDAPTYNAAVRGGTPLSMELVFTHPTETTDGVVTIWIPSIIVPEASEDGAPGDAVKQTINFEAGLPEDGPQIQIGVTDKEGEGSP